MSETMQAGRELDARIAVEVMGAAWEHEPAYPGGPCDLLIPPTTPSLRARPIWVERRCRDGRTIYPAGMPSYSTDIASAWEVVEKLKERHGVDVRGGPNDEGGMEDWRCTIIAYGYRSFQDQKWNAEADTAPLAICRAALAAVALTPEQPNANVATPTPTEETR